MVLELRSGALRAFWLATLLLAGCTRYTYDVEMSLTDSGEVRRRVGVRAADHALPANVKQELSRHYGREAVNVSAKEVAVEGQFQQAIPGDVGGRGEVVRQRSLLGDVVTYRERFRSSYDIQSLLDQRRAALNRTCELWGEWAETVAATPEAGRELREFANGTLKTDIWNASLVLELTLDRDSTLPLDQQSDVVQHQYQYGIEHGYLNQEMLARLTRPGNGQHNGFGLWIAMLDRKRSLLGLAPLRSILPPLESEARLQESLNKFLTSTPEYQASDKSSEPIGILAELMLQAIGSPLRSHDALVVTFQQSTPPFVTNGEWLAEEQAVRWEATLELPGESPRSLLPRLCYAAWSLPDEEFQQQHFGNVIFTGELLADYVAWQGTLLPDEQREWEEFVVHLQPEEDLDKRLTKFEFRSESVPADVRRALADQVRQLFRRATSQDGQ